MKSMGPFKTKKASITIFIITGIVIIMIFGLLFYVRSYTLHHSISRTKEEQIALEAYSDSLKYYITKCIREKEEIGLNLMGVQGGNLEIYLTTDSFSLVPNKFYIKGTKTMPSLKKLESDFSVFLEENIPFCLEDYKLPGYDIEEKGIDVKTSLLENEVIVEVNYPLLIKGKYNKIEISDFYVAIPVRFAHIYNISETLIDKIVEEPELIHYSLMSTFDTDFVIIPYEENSFLYSIVDNRSIINNQEYTFVFGAVFE